MADYDVTVQGHLRGFEKLDEIEAKIQSLQGKSIDIKVNADGINNLNKTLTSSNLSSSISKQYKDVGKTAGTAYATGMQARIEEMARTQRTAFSSPLLTSDERAQQAFWKNQVSSTLEQANKYSNLVSTKAMSVKLSNLQTKAQGIDSGVENYNNLSAAIEKCVAAEQQLNTAASAYSASGTLDNANAMISAYDKLATSIQTANNELKITQNNASLTADTKKVADFQKSLQTFYDNNTRMHKQYDKQKHTYILNHFNIEILYLWEKDIIEYPEKCEALILEYIGNNGLLHDYNSFNYSFIDNNLILNSQIKDGIISGQPVSNRKYLSGVSTTSWEFKSGKCSGSNAIRALQRLIGASADGYFGKASVTALQKYLKARGYYTGSIDGSCGSGTVRALQNWLNR